MPARHQRNSLSVDIEADATPMLSRAVRGQRLALAEHSFEGPAQRHLLEVANAWPVDTCDKCHWQ